MIADRIAGGEEGPAATAAWQLLDHVLRPLMWRNTKSVVAQEFHLPHRTLRPTWLAFQAGERAFYEQVPAGLDVLGACLATEKHRQTLPAPWCAPCLQMQCLTLTPLAHAGGGAGAAVA